MRASADTTEMSGFSYRPFGHPSESVPSSDKYILFTSAIFVGFVWLLNTAWISLVLYKRYRHVTEHAQRNNLILLMLTGVTAVLGLVDISDSTWNYPGGQSVFSVALGFVCWAGLSFFLMPALFVSPHFRSESLVGRSLMWIISIVLLLVGLALQIVELVKRHHTHHSIILTLFIYKLAVLTLMLCIGCYYLFRVRAEEKEHITIFRVWRVMYLVVGYLLAGGYVSFNGIEGPHSLVMRLMELLMLVGILGLVFLFAASIDKSMYNIIPTLTAVSASHAHRVVTDDGLEF